MSLSARFEQLSEKPILIAYQGKPIRLTLEEAVTLREQLTRAIAAADRSNAVPFGE